MSELRKNQELECTIEGCTGEGLGVARVGGRAIFVRDALPGECCRIQILKVSRAAVYARVLVLSMGQVLSTMGKAYFRARPTTRFSSA